MHRQPTRSSRRCAAELARRRPDRPTTHLVDLRRLLVELVEPALKDVLVVDLQVRVALLELTDLELQCGELVGQFLPDQSRSSRPATRLDRALLLPLERLRILGLAAELLDLEPQRPQLLALDPRPIVRLAQRLGQDEQALRVLRLRLVDGGQLVAQCLDLRLERADVGCADATSSARLPARETDPSLPPAVPLGVERLSSEALSSARLRSRRMTVCCERRRSGGSDGPYRGMDARCSMMPARLFSCVSRSTRRA